VGLDERMTAIDNTFERVDLSLQRLEDEMRAMRGDPSAFQRQLTRILANF
jgi:hypothetical protein